MSPQRPLVTLGFPFGGELELLHMESPGEGIGQAAGRWAVVE